MPAAGSAVPCRRRPRARTGCLRCRSQRDDEQRIDLPAVEDDEALDEAEGSAAHIDAVKIAAGGEEAHSAVMHDPRDEDIGARLGHLAIDRQDTGWADEATVG